MLAKCDLGEEARELVLAFLTQRASFFFLLFRI
jgi:hypothetical protein